MAQCKAVGGCEKEAKKMGFCDTHYMQVRRGARDPNGHLLRPLRPRYDGTLCKFRECKGAVLAKGFCTKHYQLRRFNRIDDNGAETDPSVWKSYFNPDRKNPGKAGPCRLERCTRDKVHTDLGLCGYHYRRWNLGIIDSDGNTLREEYRVRRYTDDDQCLVNGCEKRPRANNFCKYHASQFSCGRLDVEGKPLASAVVGRPRKKNPRWESNGYLMVRAPEDHPYAAKSGMMFEHRVVMEKVLGRYLEPHEVVHHKDGDRQNNDPSNLEVLTRKKHPIAVEYTEKYTLEALSALKHNDPKAYKRVMRKMNSEGRPTK